MISTERSTMVADADILPNLDASLEEIWVNMPKREPKRSMVGKCVPGGVTMG